MRPEESTQSRIFTPGRHDQLIMELSPLEITIIDHNNFEDIANLYGFNTAAIREALDARRKLVLARGDNAAFIIGLEGSKKYLFPSDGSPLSSDRTNRFYQIFYHSDLGILIGQLGALYYIIDPNTGCAINEKGRPEMKVVNGKLYLSPPNPIDEFIMQLVDHRPFSLNPDFEKAPRHVVERMLRIIGTKLWRTVHWFPDLEDGITRGQFFHGRNPYAELWEKIQKSLKKD